VQQRQWIRIHSEQVMSDDPVIPLPPGRAVDIPARFIRQAFEHLQHTGDRYVTFIFAGELVADAVCYGISTQRVPPSRMIIDQHLEPTTKPKWTISSITTSVVLEVIREHGPINAKAISDKLGIARGDIPLRQRMRRVLESLVATRVVRRSGSRRFPDYALTRGSRPKTAESSMQRRDITDEMVLEQLRTGPLTSRDIGDNLGLDRKNNSVRSKITEIIGRLIREDRVRHVSGDKGLGRMYELAGDQEQESA